MRALDFFCGAGGLTRGLLDAGVEVIAGFDLDERCQESYEWNNRRTCFCPADVNRVQPADLWKLLKSRCTGDLLIAACAPCQPFSKQRKRQEVRVGQLRGGSAVDGDATLLGAFARIVEEILPAHVLIENVPGIAKVRGFSTYRRFLAVLHANHYSVAQGVLDAKNYGVPQTRRRFVLLASRNGAVRLPQPLFGLGRQPYLTVRHAIAHYPPIAAGERHPSVPNHEAALLSQTNLLRLRCTPADGGDRRTWPKALRLRCHEGGHEGHTDVYGRMAWDRPAPTLTGRCNSLSNGRYGHPCQDRAISLREAASLQTFNDAYVFFGLQQHVARQIGNAVPVRFAEVLGRHILAL